MVVYTWTGKLFQNHLSGIKWPIFKKGNKKGVRLHIISSLYFFIQFIYHNNTIYNLYVYVLTVILIYSLVSYTIYL